LVLILEAASMRMLSPVVFYWPFVSAFWLNENLLKHKSITKTPKFKSFTNVTDQQEHR